MATTAQRSNIEIVESAYEAFNAGDIETVMGMMHEEIEWTEPEGSPFGGSYHGPEEVAEGVFSTLAAEIDGFQVTPDRYVDGGDTIVVIGESTGKGRETGRDMTVPFAHVCDLEDGKFVRFTDYTDTALFGQALGD